MKFRSLRLRAVLFSLCCLLGADFSRAEITVQILKNFTSSTLGINSDKYPPNPNGAVGPHHFVEFINGRFAVYDKVTGSNVQSMTDLGFWLAAGVDLSGRGVSDPRIRFDPLTQRWFASQVDVQFGNLTSNRFLVAVSANSDPTGTWKAVAFLADTGGDLADSPALGVDANGVYLGANLFSSGIFFLGVSVTSIPKSDLLLSTPTAANRTYSGPVTGPWGFSPQPVSSDNPSGQAGIVLSVASLGFVYPETNLTSLLISNAATSTATFTGVTNILVPDFNAPVHPPQPSPYPPVDGGDARISCSLSRVGDLIYATHSTQVGARMAIRWYKISALDRALLQSGTINDTNLDLFYPSIAANHFGHVVIGFNGCNTGTPISAYAIAAETIGSNTVFGAKVLLKAGLTGYRLLGPDGRNRWGDYSATTVDPGNPFSFWTIQEIPADTNVWATQITELRVADVPPLLTYAALGKTLILQWPTNANNFALESTSDLTDTNWSTVTNIPGISGPFYKVSLTPTAPAFYRLRK